MSEYKEAAGKLKAELEKVPEWHTATVFDDEGCVIATTMDRADPGELEPLPLLYEDRDTTVGNGLRWTKRHFEVQRFHDELVYGRLEAAREKEGICVLRSKAKSTGKPVFALITYVAPTTSARAIPMLQRFAREHIESL